VTLLHLKFDRIAHRCHTLRDETMTNPIGLGPMLRTTTQFTKRNRVGGRGEDEHLRTFALHH
jgi:hypothetical protein